MLATIGNDVQRRLARVALACVTLLAIGAAGADEPAGPAAGLYEKYAALRPELDRNAFDRPLHVASRETPDELEGDVHAVLDYPFARVQRSLKAGARWCDILILHLNVKACRASPDGRALRVYIGRKFDEAPSIAHEMEFSYRVLAEAPDYFRLSLAAERGPFGTHDYRIGIEAVPLAGERTFLHLSYAYGYGTPAKLAMQTYLATLAGAKVGFTAEGRRPDGTAVLVGGLRGALERNVMRYYLAVDAYLAALASPPDERLEDRLREWFDATERYPLQLHELDENAYLEMKRKECASPPGES